MSDKFNRINVYKSTTFAVNEKGEIVCTSFKNSINESLFRRVSEIWETNRGVFMSHRHNKEVSKTMISYFRNHI